MAEIMESIYRNLVFQAVQKKCKTQDDVKKYVYEQMKEEIGSDLVFESLLPFHYALAIEQGFNSQAIGK